VQRRLYTHSCCQLFSRVTPSSSSSSSSSFYLGAIIQISEIDRARALAPAQILLSSIFSFYLFLFFSVEIYKYVTRTGHYRAMIRAIFYFIFLTARRSLRNFPPPFWFEIFCFIIFSAAAAGGSGAGAWWTLPTVTLTYDVEPNTHTQHTHPHPLADSIGSTTTYIAPLSDGRASSETERGRPKWTGSTECKRRSGERDFPGRAFIRIFSFGVKLQ
jgi:hypothetical protein